MSSYSVLTEKEWNGRVFPAFRRSQEGRRAIELMFGVACGLTGADLLLLAIGMGLVRMGVVMALAMAATMLLGGGCLW